MKILFIKQKGEDYLGDSIYHGLKSVYGRDVACNVDLDYMYSDYPNKNQLYGKGFTLFGNLDPYLRNQNYLSKDEIETLIIAKYFDYIFYGSVWRCLDYFDLVKEYYSNDKIVLFDGEDGNSLHPLMGQHPYFKREMERKIDENLYPISFSIPKEKIINSVAELEKIKDFGSVIPGQPQTYTFDVEEEYYKDYQKSHFGVTMKKAGWDCMRHYEILANGCLPYFLDLGQCPFYTLYNFPKKLVLEANKLTEGFDEIKYNELLVDLHEYIKEHLTTEATIDYIFKILENKSLFTQKINPNITNEYERLCSPNEGESVDIKEHLPTLKQYAYQCDHVTEMGVRSVVSTWAFLDAIPVRLISYDIEYHPNIEKALVAAKEAGIQFDYILKDVLKTEIEETDFLFIDTWHTYTQLSQELKLHSPKVKKYIGFHDTVSYRNHGEGPGQGGIYPAIEEFLEKYKDEWKIKEEFTNNNGLLIIERIKAPE